MEPDKKSSIIKIVIVVVALLVATLIIVLFAYPLYQNVQSINQQVSSKTQEKKQLVADLEDLKILEENYNKAKDKAKIVNEALPTEKEMPQILVQLENIAGGNAMSFLEVSPGQKSTTTQKAPPASQPPASQPPTGALYQQVPLAVKVSGTFASLENYLKGLEQNLRILDISSISIEKGTTPEDINDKILKIDISLNAYFQPKK